MGFGLHGNRHDPGFFDLRATQRFNHATARHHDHHVAQPLQLGGVG